MAKQNWFSTLNDSLNSEGLIDAWDPWFAPIQYNEIRSWRWDDGSKYGHWVSIYRNELGSYERPVHYSC
ncbi:MAG: hypothetical protein EOM23_02015 [Candidatus Moranbacteria bacterium]|nr:hypothetical protein [Candidatus Moranbacteria bacterium]